MISATSMIITVLVVLLLQQRMVTVTFMTGKLMFVAVMGRMDLGLAGIKPRTWKRHAAGTERHRMRITACLILSHCYTVCTAAKDNKSRKFSNCSEGLEVNPLRTRNVDKPAAAKLRE